jgi:hypothetical protein
MSHSGQQHPACQGEIAKTGQSAEKSFDPDGLKRHNMTFDA